MRSTRLSVIVATVVLSSAGAVTAQSFALQVGPSIAASPRPGTVVQKKVSTDALFVVRPVGCADAENVRISGTAEGVLNGVRRSVPLTLQPLTTPGVRAAVKQWADDGIWIVTLSGECDGRSAGVIVRLGPDNTYRRDDVEQTGGVPTPAQVDRALVAAGRRPAPTPR